MAEQIFHQIVFNLERLLRRRRRLFERRLIGLLVSVFDEEPEVELSRLLRRFGRNRILTRSREGRPSVFLLQGGVCGRHASSRAGPRWILCGAGNGQGVTTIDSY